MPTYQYSCTECGHFFEQFQSFSEDSLTECPQCQGRLRKVFNAVGVVFKGSGFYRNDSRTSQSGSDTARGSSGSGESTKADSGSKGDTATSDSATSGAAKSDSAKSGTKSDSAKSGTSGSAA